MRRVMRPEFCDSGKRILGNKLVFKSVGQLNQFLKQFKVALTNEACEE